MITKNITVGGKAFDTTPIAMLVQIASKFTSSIHIISDNSKSNAKSIMGMLAIGLKNGEEITVVADGPDESDAIKNIEDYLTE